MEFGDLPTAGIWKKHPQSEYEGWEELEKIKAMNDIKYLSEAETSYQCVDNREDN